MSSRDEKLNLWMEEEAEDGKAIVVDFDQNVLRGSFFYFGPMYIKKF
jgi:hypothetical protein